MDNTFTLLSTMSPTIKKRNRNIIHQKVPTKLALKKNIRRSSIFDSLPPTALNKSLILVEGSTTDTTNSNSTHSGLTIINSSPITISDSDSTNSENCTPFQKVTDIHNKLCKIPNDCGLSESKFNAIDKWVSNVQNENIRPSSLSNDLPETRMTKPKYDFEELINSIERTLRLQESGNNTNKNLGQNQSVDKQFSNIKDSSNHEANDFIAKNDFITNRSVKKCRNVCTFNMVTSTIKANDSVSSSSDVIEDSDDVNYHNRNTKNILLPRSEPRYRKKKTNSHKIAPKTEVKQKPKWSIVHKNPYLDSEQKSENTPSMQSVASLEAPWTKRLQALCDSDSSDQSFNEQRHRLPGVNLFFSDNKDSCDNKITHLHKTFDVLEKPHTYFLDENESNKNAQNINSSIDSDKENFSDFSDDNETLDDKLRKKVRLKKTKVAVSGEHKKEATEALVKPNTYLLERKQSEKNVQNIDKLIDSETETFSDFSDDNETLEDRLRRKLGLDKKSKNPVSRKNKTKETKDDLKSIFIKTCNNFKDRNISPSEVCNEADLANDKLLKKTNICKTKTTAKTKVVKKKPLTCPEGGIVNKANNQKSVASKGSKINLDDICKSFLSSLSGCVPLSQCDPSARIFRNNFKMYRSELVTKLFKLYNEEVFSDAIPEDSLIEWSERMRGTAGYCYCKKITRRTGLIERKVRIVLASKVLDCADRVRDTLIHEMCHAATWIVNEVADGHGSYWKAWAHKVRQTFPELPPIKVCHNYTITTKYTYKCTKCGYSFGRHSKSLDVERKRCGHCYGTFEILINKTTKGGETKSVPITPKKAVTGFALFVKENYASYKTPQLTHGQIMKLLGQKFGELKVSVCKEDKEKA